MSLLYTESFFAFGEYNGDDTFDASPGGANAARAAYNLNLKRAGYATFVPANDAADTSGGLVVRPDPVNPDQNALAHSSAAGAAVNLGVSAAFKKRLPIIDKQTIIGFSLYVPPEYVPNAASSTVPVLRVNAGPDADPNWQGVSITPIYSAKECFRICNDLSIRWGTDAPQASKKLTVGAVNYMEIRIDAATVSIWIDDVFVMQKTVSLVSEAVAFIFENNANPTGTNMSGAPGRWSLGNMYYMAIDGVAPQQRLGPTTRVIGQRPDTDIDVRFIRPLAAPSNASVAAQDLVDSPPQQLQSTNIGDFDTYATEDPVTGAAIRTLGLVHAVTVKTLAANLEPDPHKVRPYAKAPAGGAEGADNKVRELSLVAALPAGRTIRALGLRPGDTRIWALGDNSSVYVSGANYDYSTWTRVVDGNDAGRFIGMASRPDGLTVLAWDNGSNTQSRYYQVSGAAPVAFNYPGITNTDFGQYNSGGANDIVMGNDNATFIAGTFGSLTTSWVLLKQTNPLAAWTILSSPGTFPGNGTTGALVKTASAILASIVNNAGQVGRTTNSAASTAGSSNNNVGDTTAGITAFTFDGTAVLAAMSSNDNALNGGPRIRRSVDNGNSWAGVTQAGSNLQGGNQVLRRGVSNLANGESIFVGDGGAVVATLDGINFKQLPRLTAQNLYAAVALPNGDFILGGGGGALLRYGSPDKDTALVPLAGYTMAFGSAIFNPATGTTWTPAEAADAQFGVRLIS